MDKKLKIAVVDDENEILEMINRYLSKTGKYEVHVFSNPMIALERINETFDGVLLDIMMPQMDGLSALEKLHSKYPELTIIMMTAYSTLDRVLKSHKEGATNYIMKPFESLGVLEKKLFDEITSKN